MLRLSERGAHGIHGVGVEDVSVPIGDEGRRRHGRGHHRRTKARGGREGVGGWRFDEEVLREVS